MDDVTLDPDWRRILNQSEKSHKRVAKFENYKNNHLEQARNNVNRDRLRSKKKPNRFVIDNEYVKNKYLAKFPPVCTQVLLALLVHCNLDRQDAFPSLETIKDQSGCTNLRSIVSALRILNAYGIIGIDRSKKGMKLVNLYTFQSVRYWRRIPEDIKKIKLTDPLPNWQNPIQSTGKNETRRTSSTASLTNLNENYNNKIQNIADILRKRFGMPEAQAVVAIPTPSSNTVADAKNAEDTRVDVPANAGEMQCGSNGNSASTIEPRKNGEKTAESGPGHGMSTVDNTTQEQRSSDNIKNAYEH